MLVSQVLLVVFLTKCLLYFFFAGITVNPRDGPVALPLAAAMNTEQLEGPSEPEQRNVSSPVVELEAPEVHASTREEFNTTNGNVEPNYLHVYFETMYYFGTNSYKTKELRARFQDGYISRLMDWVQMVSVIHGLIEKMACLLEM